MISKVLSTVAIGERKARRRREVKKHQYATGGDSSMSVAGKQLVSDAITRPRLFSRMMNSPLILLKFCLWLMMVSSSCQAFQCPNARSSWRRSLDTTKLHGFFSRNITRLHYDVVDETFRGTFNQTDDANDGKIKNDLPMSLITSASDISRQFPKHCSKSWSNLVYGFRFRYRNLFSLSLWQLVVAQLPPRLLGILLNTLEELSPTMQADVIRVFGNFMFHTSFVVSAVARAVRLPIVWLLLPRFRWQQNLVYLEAVFFPIWEEIVYRLMLYRLWQWVLQYIHSGGKLQGESEDHRSSFVSLLEHKYSFRVLSSLIFGFAHILNYDHLWESNEIDRQIVFIFKGMSHAFATFFSSFFCYVPLFETRGVMAAIGAHSAWNLLGVSKSIKPSPIIKSLALDWAIIMFFKSSGGGMSAVLHKLTPPQPSRAEERTIEQ